MIKHFINTATSIVILASSFQQAIARNCKLNETFSKHVTIKSSLTEKLPTDTTPKLPKKVTLSNAAKVGSTTGKITGKIIYSKTGEPVYDATITIKSGNVTRITKSDYNGVYTVNELPEGTYTINVSHITYGNKKLEDVKIVSKDVTTQDIVLQESKGKNLEEVVVTTKGAGRIKESVSALLVQQKNAASVSDGISAEAIKRTPDKTTSDIMKRVSGASVQDDRFVVIRGLNDRYNAAFINGAPLPSSESDRKAFAFDVFPANMLDNLIIVKTATPDMNADFAGGTIYINTKDIPAKNFQSISIGAGYNTATTFKEFKSEKKGRWDWLGIDDGTKKLSSDLPSDNLNNYSSTDKARFGSLIKNNWKPITSKAPMNTSFQFVKGLNVQKHQKDFLGIIFAATYNKSQKFTDGSRISQDLVTNFSDKTYTTQVLAGLMGNVSLKLNENNKFSFKNLYSINSDYRVIDRVGTSQEQTDLTIMSKALWYTSNKIASSQLLGEHFWKQPKIKFNWTGGYTSIKREIPSLRRMLSNYDNTDPSQVYQNVNAPNSLSTYENSGTIFTSATNENIKSIGADALRKFSFDNYNSIQLKAGYYYQIRNRDFAIKNLTIYQQHSGSSNDNTFDNSLTYLPEDSIFRAENFGKLSNGKNGFGLSEFYLPDNNYNAESKLNAYYFMLDARISKFIRINGGIRSEKFNQVLNSLSNSVNTTIIDNLPSANLIVSLNSKQNLRFSYSQTLNRPEYRELAPFIFYDYFTGISIFGNTKLERAKLDNYDFRYEFYPSGGQLISASFFYKKIPNSIEFVYTTVDKTATYINAVDGKISGLEFEIRANIGSTIKANPSNFLSHTTLFGNASFINSEVSFGKDSLVYGGKRNMQGQSPYIYNGGITYLDQNGYSATAQVNYAAPRVWIGGSSNNTSIVENGRAILDLQLAKTFEKRNIELKLNVSDILARRILRFYDIDNDGKYDESKDRIFSTAQPGRVISASITYKF